MKRRKVNKLLESVRQADEILRGVRRPSREFHVDAAAVKELRAKLEISQAKFAALLDVDIGTLRNWEQGRREPTGPAKACCARFGTIRNPCCGPLLPDLTTIQLP